MEVSPAGADSQYGAHSLSSGSEHSATLVIPVTAAAALSHDMFSSSSSIASSPEAAPLSSSSPPPTFATSSGGSSSEPNGHLQPTLTIPSSMSGVPLSSLLSNFYPYNINPGFLTNFQLSSAKADERRPWTKEEDQKVTELVQQYGTKKWSQIPAHTAHPTGASLLKAELDKHECPLYRSHSLLSEPLCSALLCSAQQEPGRQLSGRKDGQAVQRAVAQPSEPGHQEGGLEGGGGHHHHQRSQEAGQPLE